MSSPTAPPSDGFSGSRQKRPVRSGSSSATDRPTKLTVRWPKRLHEAEVSMRRWAALFLSLAATSIPAMVSAGPVGVEAGKAWVEDPYSQTIFFAVLEGLYRDGVSNDVVDLVLA